MIRLGRVLLIFIVAIGALLLAPERSHAQVEHQLLRRIVVFPLKAEAEPGTSARETTTKAAADSYEEAWWQVREELTDSRRFLVASKQFLVKSDVYLPRGELAPADAVILGKLLDAHALITMQTRGRILSMQAFDGTNGMPLWRKELTMHPSMPATEQLPGAARKLIDDFIASLPYQGFTFVDPMVGKAVFEEGDVLLTQVDVGVASQIQPGDPVQWIRIFGTSAAPLFQGGSKLTVFAEGRVVKIDQGIATVEILRATRADDIKEFALVRFPREGDRLQTQFSIRDNVRGHLSVELAAPEMSPMEQLTRERKPLITTVSWLSSLAAFLLLAF